MSNLTILNSEIRTLDNLYSLNDLHKVSGSSKKHQPSLFLVNAQTKELIMEIERSTDMQIDISDQGIPRSVKTKRGGKNQGTFACKEIVYAYAMWISPKFNLQVIRSFDAMVNQQTKTQHQIEQKSKTLTPAQQRHIQERVNDLVHAFKDNNHQLQYSKIKTKFKVGTYKDILASDYPKVCQFLNCLPRVDLESPVTVEKEELFDVEQHKYAMANDLIKRLDIKDEPVLVPYVELANIVQKARNVQLQIKQLASVERSLDDWIGKLKINTGRSLLDF